MGGPRVDRQGTVLHTSIYQMKRPPKPIRPWPVFQTSLLFLLATFLGLALFFLHRNIGLSLSDEGYLWYGADRTFQGEVPLRDFQSYAPGRYYWCAAWFHLSRPGIVSLRFAECLFRILGLFFGLLAARRVSRNLFELAGLGLLLALWIYPDYKCFDCAIPLMALYLAFRLWTDPSRRMAALAGAFVGLSTFFGFNHGLYLLASFGVLMGMVCRRFPKWKSSLGCWLAGILAGALPYFVLLSGVKGFGKACLGTLKSYFETGAYLSLPVPWPRILPLFQAFNPFNLSQFLVGALFIALPLAYAFWFLRIIFDSRKILSSVNGMFLWLCALVGLPYLHYVFGRADIYHLAAGTAPFWLGCWIVASPFKAGRLLVLAFGLLTSFFSIGFQAQWMEGLRPSSDSFVECRIGEDTMALNRGTAAPIAGLLNIVQNLKPGESLLFYPHLPGLYAVFQKKSPLWEIYSVFPPKADEERKLIGEVETSPIRWCVIDIEGMDGRRDLEFENAHPVFWEYLSKNWRRVPSDAYSLPSYLAVYNRDNRGSSNSGLPVTQN